MRRGRPSPSDPLRSKRSPWRLWRTALLLGVVLIGWQWTSEKGNRGGGSRSEPGADSLPSLSQLDFEVQPDGASPTLTRDESPPASPASPGEPTDSANRLPPAWLVMMQDARLGLTPSEQIGLDRVLQYVRSHTAAQLHTAATRGVGFVSLHQHPEQYRGQLLEIEGTLWNLSLLTSGAPTRPGEELYEAWLYTPHAENHPTRVLFTDLPATLKPGERLNQPVQCAGYFIKRYGYKTPRGTHIAPLFVARTLQLIPSAQVAPPAPPGKSWRRRLGELLVVVAASALIIGYLTRSRNLPDSENPSEE